MQINEILWIECTNKRALALLSTELGHLSIFNHANPNVRKLRVILLHFLQVLYMCTKKKKQKRSSE